MKAKYFLKEAEKNQDYSTKKALKYQHSKKAGNRGE